MSLLKDLLTLKKTLIINGKRGLEENLDILLFQVLDEKIANEIRATDVANYFLSKAKDEKKMIQNFHLQSLVYLSQGIYIGAYNDTLFKDDVMAWDFGPVITDLYDKLRIYGNGFVSDYIGEYSGREIFEIKAKQVLEKVWQDFFINYNEKYENPVTEISALMKSQKSAWYKYFIKENKKYNIIELRDIAKYHSTWIKPK